jgi:hypothetical protein
MEARMTSYRVYRLDRAGRIVTGEWIEASDDSAARVSAHEFCNEATPLVELWQGKRFVAQLPCEDEEAA